jgi:hypothetical protein
MPEGKWNAYDTDIRIPFIVRGPGIEVMRIIEHSVTYSNSPIVHGG